MNILEESRSILETGGYRTALSSSAVDTFHFEDDTILGAVFVHDNVASLLERWQTSQDSFLGSNSRSLRIDPVKAWNVYTVHLTADTGSGPQVTQAFNIEHDFRGTRKVVRTGVAKRSDVKDALLPLLGLQHRLTLSLKKTTDRTKERLALSSAILVRLLDNTDDSTVAIDLLEEP
jgi:hypothetical protein